MTDAKIAVSNKSQNNENNIPLRYVDKVQHSSANATKRFIVPVRNTATARWHCYCRPISTFYIGHYCLNISNR